VSEIKISPTVQIVALAAIGAGVLAAVAAQLPEIRRYLSIKSM
jgi:hypothetical protein